MGENDTEKRETQAVLGLLARDQIGDTVNLVKDDKVKSLKFESIPGIGTIFEVKKRMYRVTLPP